MRLQFILIGLFTVCLVKTTECARILGAFPMPGQSHYILASKLMKGLVKAGHDVTMISPYEMKDVPKGGKYTDIVLDGVAEQFAKSMKQYDLFSMLNMNPLQLLTTMTNMFAESTNAALHNDKIKKMFNANQKFDAVILEQFSNDALKVFGHIFDCPVIVLSSMGANAFVNPLVGNPQPVAYAGHYLLGDISNDLSIKNRALNLLFHVQDFLVTNYYVLPKHDEIIRKIFPNAPSIYDLNTNVSLVLLNCHTSLYPALPLVPNMVEIGGYFIDPPKKLPEDLQQILDSAKEGLVYFSMGSNLKSKDLPKEKRQALLKAFGKLKQKVLWKFEEDLPDKPPNVVIRSWLPQQDVLAHPNVKLFITHGGLLSTTETIYHGVPVLAIPVFGDQNLNADLAVSKGFGLKLPYSSPDFNEETLSRLLNELLGNLKYLKNAKIRSKLYHDRTMKPMDTAVYWIEYVIRHRGATHLRVAGIRLPWYKYFMVDVLSIIIICAVVAYMALKFVIKKICCKRRQTKQKTS
ncbi:UDP-glycosyltransferase UGT5-like [Anthonomus grandis grandis]|uniref:UDP-glycosyltransferase UGT5-like n=1 Tax=Anthonomus grandis grandis TaxID=2921223 RepID=UPI0021653177|nr:UDP-glycosyltransferase UGT5-like [Anthonomus grandis grandis]